mgnify:FL=1
MIKPKFLDNPKTHNYTKFKDLVLSKSFSWFRVETLQGKVMVDNKVCYVPPTPYITESDLPPDCAILKLDENFDNYSYLSHKFLQKPEDSRLYSTPNSEYVEYIHQIFKEIADFNDLNPQVIFRMNANAVYPTEKKLPSPLHVDHNFPHKNMLIYLTDPQGGSTIVEDEDTNLKEYLAKEDDVLMFDGQSAHCAIPPSKDVRIVLVITFL